MGKFMETEAGKWFSGAGSRKNDCLATQFSLRILKMYSSEIVRVVAQSVIAPQATELHALKWLKQRPVW